MKTVYAYSYGPIKFVGGEIKLDLPTNYQLRQELEIIQKHEDSLGIYEYISDLDEYRRTRIKKLYVKGGYVGKVPRQVLNIETQSFITDPQEYLEKYNIEFEEFV